MGGKGAVVVDIDPSKREAAKKAGALGVVDGRAADAVQQIQAQFKDGVWGVIDLVGASDTVKLGIDCMTKGGKLVVCGLFGGEITIPTPYIPMRALTIQGSYVGTPGEMRELLALMQRARPATIPITKRPLAEANAALEDLKAGKQIGRSVLMPAG
jgi:D-arabinose 1-dehydrogenase-like Zn-dependent alcohol dehydrogenase